MARIVGTSSLFEDNFYVAAVFRSESGFLEPKLIKDETELDAYYGSFKYSEMYRGLLQNGIPIVAIPQLTEIGPSNICTLRLNYPNEDDTKVSVNDYISYCYPRVNKNYTQDDTSVNEVNISSVHKGFYCFSHILDFENCEFEYGSYFIIGIDVNCPNEGGTTYRKALFFIGNDIEDTPVIIDYYTENYAYLIPYRRNGDKLYYINSIIGALNQFKNDLEQGKNDSDRVDIYQPYRIDEDGNKIYIGYPGKHLIIKTELEMLTEAVNLFHQSFDGTLYDTNESLIELRERYQGSDLEIQTEIEDSLNEYISHLYEFWDYEDQSYLDEAKLRTVFKLVCDMIIENWISDSENNKGSFPTRFNSYLISFLNSDSDKKNYRLDSYSTLKDTFSNKIYLQYSRLTRNTRIFNMKNFKITNHVNYDNDRLSSLTEANKLIEFHSKFKGPKGRDLKIKITKVSDLEYKYQLDIWNDFYSERHMINTANETIDAYVNSSEDISLIKDNYISIKEVGLYSKLVEVKLFDYRLSHDKYIAQTDFLELYPDGEYRTAKLGIDYVIDKNYNVILNSDFIGEVPVVPIPECLLGVEFHLDRVIEEDMEYDKYTDHVRSMEKIREAEYYPDLILVPQLDFKIYETDNDKWKAKSNLGYINYLADYCDEKCSQVFVNLRADQVDYTHNREMFYNHDSRILYFYNDLIIDKQYFSCFYPYVINFRNQNYLGKVQNRIIYNIDGLVNGEAINQDTLTKLRVNFLKYNNFRYSYDTLLEVDRNPNFIIRFITSKVSRMFMLAESELINCEYTRFADRVKNIVRDAIQSIPLIENLSSTITSKDNFRVVELSLSIKGIVNKYFKFNISIKT